MWNLEVKAKAMHRWSGLSFCIVCFSQVNSDATQEGATRFDLTEVEAQPEFAVEAMPTCLSPEQHRQFQCGVSRRSPRFARRRGLGLK